MFHQKTARAWYAMGVALALAAAPLAAQQGSAAPNAASPAPAPDSAKQPVHKSRFGRFGRAFEKAANTAAAAGSRAGLTKETAARLAVTAATGGAAAALMSARQQSALSAVSLTSRALAASSGAPAAAAPIAAPTAASIAAARARLATGSVDTATASAAVRALTELGQISVRAQQHDPAAVHAMQVLDAAMAKPDAGFVALQQRATAGDPSAAQQIIIREDAIAHAALGGRAP